MRRLWVFMLSLAMLVMLVPSTALGLDVRSGTGFTVAKGEVVDDDLVVTATRLTIDGTVNGDVYAAVQTVQVNGEVNGTLYVAGDVAQVQGTVSGGVVFIGSLLNVSGKVGRSVLGLGSELTLEKSGTVGSNWIAAADRSYLLGTVGRGIAFAGDNLRIDGSVQREVKAAIRQLTFGASAEVKGDVDYASDSTAGVATGAKVGTLTRHEGYQRVQVIGPWWSSGLWLALKVGGFLAVGLLLLALFPRLRATYPQVVLKMPWQAPLTGFAALIGTPIVSVLLMITIIGLPLALVLLISYPILIYVGQILFAWTVGKLVADRIDGLRTVGWPVIFLIGTAITTLLLQVPYIGGIAAAVAVIVGLGALYLTIINWRRYEPGA